MNDEVRSRWVLRLLCLYSGVLTVALAVLGYVVFSRLGGTAVFDRIRVHRIDIVEPDGTPRLILSDRAAYPGSFFHGVETPRPDRRNAAGMLMMNDEGSEDGGFIWGGLARDGKPMNFSHLSFDQYEQDQTLSFDAATDDGAHLASVRLNDMPDAPLTPALIDEYERLRVMPDTPANQQAMAAFLKRFPSGHRRAALERIADGSVALTLDDVQGRPRLRAAVDKDGEPRIEFLGDDGRVVKVLNVASKP